MAVSEIVVTSGLPHQEIQVPIEGSVYLLEIRWAGREARWYIDIYDEDRDPIYMGVALVLNFPLAVRCADSRMWPGVVMAMDTSGANAEPLLGDLGDRVKLFYFDSTEIPIDLDA